MPSPLFCSKAVAACTFAFLLLISCSDDENPVTQIRFEVSQQKVKESDGTLESFHPGLIQGATGRIIPIVLTLSEPAPDDISIDVLISGTALRETNVNNLSDYTFEAGAGVGINGSMLTIMKGTTEAVLKLRLWEDFNWEYDEDHLDENDIPYETVSITLQEVHGPGKINTSVAAEVTHTLRIMEDDNLVLLEWDDTGLAPGAVNMDIFVYIDGFLSGVADEPNTSNNFETITIPGGFPDMHLGMGYVYRKGVASPLDFHVMFYNLGGTLTDFDGIARNQLDFYATYYQANINNYNSSNPTSQVEQTLDKLGFDLYNFSHLFIPDTGSRMAGKKKLLLRDVMRKSDSQHTSWHARH
ncbi:MAG TPA: hypothetical protein VGK59_03700 [Ohtaekwangia sp.]